MRMMRAFKVLPAGTLLRRRSYVSVVPNPEDTDIIYQGRQNRDEIMDKRYTTTSTMPPRTSAQAAKPPYSNNLALAMMSEICLYEGTYCKVPYPKQRTTRPPTPFAPNCSLERAVAAAKAIIDQNYSLNASYIANYNSVELESNPEMIFYKEYKEATLTHQTNIQFTCRTTTIAGLSKDAFDSYPLKDGPSWHQVSGDAAHEARKRDYGYITEGIVAGIGDGASKGFISSRLTTYFANRDKRLSETIDPVIGYGTTDNGMTCTAKVPTSSASSTGYLIRKFDNPEIPGLTAKAAITPALRGILARLNIYCNYAEAKSRTRTSLRRRPQPHNQQALRPRRTPRRTVAELQRQSTTPQRRERKQHHLGNPSLPPLQETMLDADLRYWDLQRWHMLDRLDTSKYPNIRLGANLGEVAPYNYTNDKGEAKTFTLPTFANMSGNYMQAIPGNDRIFSAREYLYPIPSEQITLTQAPGSDKSSLEQNALWK